MPRASTGSRFFPLKTITFPWDCYTSPNSPPTLFLHITRPHGAPHHASLLYERQLFHDHKHFLQVILLVARRGETACGAIIRVKSVLCVLRDDMGGWSRYVSCHPSVKHVEVRQCFELRLGVYSHHRNRNRRVSTPEGSKKSTNAIVLLKQKRDLSSFFQNHTYAKHFSRKTLD